MKESKRFDLDDETTQDTLMKPPEEAGSYEDRIIWTKVDTLISRTSTEGTGQDWVGGQLMNLLVHHGETQ